MFQVGCKPSKANIRNSLLFALLRFFIDNLQLEEKEAAGYTSELQDWRAIMTILMKLLGDNAERYGYRAVENGDYETGKIFPKISF